MGIERALALLNEKIKKHRNKRMGRLRARYWKLLFAECGSDLKVNGKPWIYSPHKIHVGDHFIINGRCTIAPRGEVHIGNYVTMSRGSQITAGTLDVSTWPNEGYKEHRHTQGDVYIGDGAWLCINSIVLPGVHITGKGVIVAAGAVVTKDITEDYVVYGGVPAKLVKRLTPEEYTEEKKDDI